MIRGLIFDFDGLILETEEPIYQAWQEVYQSYGCHFSLQTWTSIIGTAAYDFEPILELERQLGTSLNHKEIESDQRTRESQKILKQPVLPGVRHYLNDAKAIHLKIGLASSSTCDWVVGHLDRLGLLEYFDAIKGSDDVQHTKPEPELYLAALDELGLPPEQAIVLEDSPHGVTAAKRAGIYTVAVPNVMTCNLQFEHADLHLGSLEDMPLRDLIDLAENNH